MGGCVSVRQKTCMVVRGLGCAVLCLCRQRVVLSGLSGLTRGERADRPTRGLAYQAHAVAYQHRKGITVTPILTLTLTRRTWDPEY